MALGAGYQSSAADKPYFPSSGYTKVPSNIHTGCAGKIVFFFSIHCNHSLAYIAVRDLQSSQRNASVQSLLLAGNFLCYQ